MMEPETELESSDEEEFQSILSAIQGINYDRLFPNIDLKDKKGLFFVREAKLAWQTNGYKDGSISGEKSIGKTAYAYWCLWETYCEDWSLAKNFMFMNPVLILRIFQELNRLGIRLPLAIIDDASTGLNKSRWWTDDTQNFSEFYNVIRSVVGGCLFTSPSDHIPSSIYRDIKYKIHIKSISRKIVKQALENNDDFWLKAVARINDQGVDYYLWRKAVLYTTFRLPSGDIRISPNHWEDIYPYHYPDDVYAEYNEMRRKRVALLIDRCLNPDKPKPVGRPNSDKTHLKAAYEALKEFGLSDDDIAKKMDYNSRQALGHNIKTK